MNVGTRTKPKDRLAIEGGEPIRAHSLPPWPHYTEVEIERVTDVLRSGAVNYWTGREVRSFEEEFTRQLGRRFGIAVANGTVALELSLRSLQIGQGDEVIVTPRSFFASVSTVIQCGAVPVFVDVDRDSQNVSVKSIEAAITTKTQALLLVHLAGWPCDMVEIEHLANRYNLRVIEDCAQAHGASRAGKAVGSSGDVAAFSFCHDKIMTTCGEGGLLVTDDESIWRSAWAYKDHGKSFSAVYESKHSTGFRWLHESIGSNFRMTEIQAAVGRIQLAKLDESVRARRRNADFLTDCFAKIEALRVTTPAPEIHHSYYRYYVFVRPERLREGWTRDRVIQALEAEGVPCFSGSCPEIYREKALLSAGYGPPKRLPVARELGETSLSFLVHPTLDEEDMQDVCAATRKVFRAATKS